MCQRAGRDDPRGLRERLGLDALPLRFVEETSHLQRRRDLRGKQREELPLLLREGAGRGADHDDSTDRAVTHEQRRGHRALDKAARDRRSVRPTRVVLHNDQLVPDERGSGGTLAALEHLRALTLGDPFDRKSTQQLRPGVPRVDRAPVGRRELPCVPSRKLGDGAWLGQAADRARDITERGESAVERAARRASCGLTELAIDDRRQTREPTLDQIVVRSGAHRVDGDVLAHRAGHDHERDVWVAATDHLQRRPRTEVRHAVIREHDVPGSPREGLVERLAVENALVPDLVSRAAQLASQ